MISWRCKKKIYFLPVVVVVVVFIGVVDVVVVIERFAVDDQGETKL